jgi:hypothetical protein
MDDVIKQHKKRYRAAWLKCFHQEIVQRREEALASDRTDSNRGGIQEIINKFQLSLKGSTEQKFN